MADRKISQLNDGVKFEVGDEAVVNRSGANFKVDPTVGFVQTTDLGTDPNQVPLNQYLGSMAYQDLDAVSITGGTATLDSADIDGGTIDGVTIGGSSAGAITGTTGQFNTSLNVDGTVTADGLVVGGSTDNAQYAELSSSGLRALRLSSFSNNGNDNAGHDINASSSFGAVTLSTGGTTRFKLDNNGDISFYEDTGTTPAFFWDASAEALGIGTTSPSQALDVVGNIGVSGGVYLGGTGAANLLDDYETGTWTPVIVGGTTAGTGTYIAQEGIYTKVGDLVTVTCWLDWSAHTGTGAFQVGGLPFASSTAVNLHPGSTYASNFDAGTSATQLIVYTSGSNSAQFRGFVNNATRATTDMNTSGRVGFTISYREA